MGLIAQGGKGKIYKCKILEFDNDKYIQDILKQFPEMLPSDIEKMMPNKVIIVKL